MVELRPRPGAARHRRAVHEHGGLLAPRELLLAAAAALALYALGVAALALAGRGAQARALARLLPDCLVLARRLLGDPRLTRGDRLLLSALVAYLVLPFDLVPDVIPVAGQLDDAILVGVVLRRVLRRAGPALLAEHWPGPPEGLRVLGRIAGLPDGQDRPDHEEEEPL